MTTDRLSPRRCPSIVSSAARTELPVRLRAWDGSETGPPGTPWWCSAPRALAPSHVESRRARSRPGVRHRRPRRRRGRRSRLPSRVARQPANTGCGGRRSVPATRLHALADAIRLGAIGPPPRRPAPRRCPSGGCTAGAATGPPSPTTTTCRTTSTSSSSTNHGLLVPRTGQSDAPGLHPRRRAARRSSTWCAEAGRRARDAAARRRLRLGIARASTRPRDSAHRSPASRCREQQLDFVRKRVADNGLDGPVERSAAGLPRPERRPVRRVASIEMGEHVGEENYPMFTATLHRLLDRKVVCSCSRCPRRVPRRAAARSSRRTSRPTCTCDRSVRLSA